MSAEPDLRRGATGPVATWLPLLVLAAAITVVYAPVVASLWSDWLTDANYTHGVLVPPAVAWLVWRRRVELRTIGRRPSHAGALIVAASLGVFLLGQAAFEFFLTRMSLLGVVAGVVVQLLGWRHLRVCLFPLLLFALAIPVPALLFNQVAFPMQLLASQFGVAALDVAGIPAIREGNIILLERATLEVAEACSGIRSLISLGTVALFCGAIGGYTRQARVLVAVAVMPVVVVANGFRVAGAGAVAHVYGAETAAGFLHTFSGWLFFLAAILMLVAVERGAVALSWPGGPSQPGTPRTA